MKPSRRIALFHRNARHHVLRGSIIVAALLLCAWAGLRAGLAHAEPVRAPAAAAPAQAASPEITTLRLYGDSVVCDSCIEGEGNRPATAGSATQLDPNTGRVPEDPPYTDPRGPFSPLSAEAPRHDYVTWNPAWISERLGETGLQSDWACANGFDEVSAASNIRAGGVNAAEKVWLRHWYEPTRLDKDLNADDCLTDQDGDGQPDAPVNPSPSSRDEWYPAIMTELTYLLTENELPVPNPEGDEVDDQAPRPMCGQVGQTRWIFPVGTFEDQLDPLGPAEGFGLTSLDYDFDGSIDMVNVTSERQFALDQGFSLDFDGDGALDALDPDGTPLTCDELVVMHTDAMTIGADDALQFLDHFVRVRAVGNNSVTLDIWYHGDLQPRRIDTRSVGDGSLALAGDVGPVTVINAGGGNLGTVPVGAWFVLVDGVDANDGTATLIVGRALGAPCASMESTPNNTNLSAGGPWFLKRFYVDGHEFNTVAIMSCSETELQYLSLRAPLPKVPVTIEQHSVRLQPYPPQRSLVLPPPFNHEHTVLEDVVLVADETVGPCPVEGVDPNPLQPEPRPNILYMGGPVGPVPPVLNEADGLTYDGRDPDNPVGPYSSFEDFLASHWFYVEEDVNPQMLGQLREKYGIVDPATTDTALFDEGFFYNEQIWTRPWNYTEFYMPDQHGFEGCDPDAYYVTSGFTNPTARWRLWSQPDDDVPDDMPPPPPDLVLDNAQFDEDTGQYGAPRRASWVFDPDRDDKVYSNDEGVRVYGGWPRCEDGDCTDAGSRPDVVFGAGDVDAEDPLGYPVEVPPYTDPFAPFNPQAPDAPRGDSLTFNPAYMDEFRNFGEPLRLLYQQLSNRAMNAREKVYHRLWYQPEYVTKIRTSDDCDDDLSFPAIVQEFTYLMMDTTDNPVSVPVPGSRLGLPIATGASELPRPNRGGTLPAGGEFGHGLTTFDADFDGFPEAVSLHTESSINDHFDATFQANRPQPPPGIPVLPLPGPLVDFDGDGIVTDTLDADCTLLNGNEMIVVSVESIPLDADDDTPEGHAAQVLDHLAVVENITGGANPEVQLRFYFAGGSIANARPEQVGGVRTLPVGGVAVVDRFQDNVTVLDPGESNAGMTDGAWFVFVEDVSESGERVVLTVGRALGATHSAIDDGAGNHDLTPGDPWYLKRFYVDGHEYNMVALAGLTPPGADPTDPAECNSEFAFLTIRTPVPKGNFFNPQDSLFQQGYFLDQLPPEMSVMPPFNVDHTIAVDVERREAEDFANVERFDACVGDLAPAEPLEERIVAEEPEPRFANELRETYRPGETTPSLFNEDGWETHQTALTPGQFTDIALPEGQQYLLTSNWRTEVGRLAFYGCTRDEPGPFDDEEFPPQLDHDDVAEIAATWDSALVLPVNRFDPRDLDQDANGINDIVPFYDGRCAPGESQRVKLFYDPTDPDDIYVNKRPFEGPPIADMAIEKTVGDSTPAAGEDVIFTLTVQNFGPEDVPSATVVDALPDGATYVSDTDSCVSDGGSPEQLTCTLGPIAAGDQAVFAIAARLDDDLATDTALINTATVTVPGTFDNDPSNNTDDAEMVTRKEADLRVVKTPSSTTVVAGGTVVYTLVATNDGPSSIEGVTLWDRRPLGVTIIGTTRPGPCQVFGTEAVACFIDELDAGESWAVDVIVEVPADTPPGTVITNEAEVEAATPDPNPANNTDDAAVIVVSQSDLSIAKTANPDPVTAGELLTYTLTITNAGPSDATMVTVEDDLPPATTLVSTSGASCSGVPVGGTGTLTCLVGNVPAGATHVVTVVVRVDSDLPPGASVSNSATVTDPPGEDPNPGNDDDSSTVPVETRADIWLEKSAPAEVFPGVPFNWTVTVHNDGPSDAADVVVTDTLPADTTYVSASGATCSGVPVGSTGTLTCQVGTVPAGDSAAFTIRLRPADDATDGQVLTNEAQVGTSTVDPDPANNQTTDTTVVRRRADLSLSKTAPATAAAGDLLTYALSVFNAGPSTATDVVVQDTLPASMSYVSSTGGCVESPGGSGQLSCAVGDIPPSGSLSFQITVRIAADVPNGTVLTNDATVTGTTPDPDGGNNDDDAPVTVRRSSDLSVSKSDQVDPVVAGERLTYTVGVENLGPSDAADVEVVDMLPAGTSYVSDTDSCVEAPAGTLTCDLGDLAAGASTSFDVVVDVAPDTADGSVLVNRAEADSGSEDPASGNNVDTESTTVTTRADVSVTKTASTATPVAGETFQYTIEVTNAGPSVATNVTVVDVLPAELEFVSSTGGCVESPAQTLTCDLGDLAPASTTSFTITVLVLADTPDGTVVSNSATVTADPEDPDPSDDSDDEDVTVRTSADLAVEKSGPNEVEPGTQMVYAVLVSNLGPSDATGVVVTDTLPAGVTYVSDTDSCTETAPGSGVLVCAPGDVPAGSSTSFSVVVAVDGGLEDGTVLTNVARVDAQTPDPNGANDEDSADTTVRVQDEADLRLDKVALDDEPGAGELVSFRIEVTNEGPRVATGVVVTDTLPSGLSYEFDSDSCVQGPPGTLVCSLPDLGSGAFFSFTITARVDGSTPAGTVLTNSATTGSDVPDPNPSDNSDDADVTVRPRTDLRLDKSATPDPVAAGALLTYTLEVTNDGPSEASGVMVTDTLPSGVSYVSDDASCQTSGLPQIVCTIGDLGAGASQTVTIVVRVDGDLPAGTTLTNSATVGGNEPDPDGGDNDDGETVTVERRTDLRLSKAASHQERAPGQLLTYTLTVENLGPSDATGVTITDTLPSNVTYQSDDSGCDTSGLPEVVCDVGNLPAGASATVEIVVQVDVDTPAGTVLTNSATVGGDDPDPDGGNDDDSTDTTVTALADLSVGKSGVGEVTTDGTPPGTVLVPDAVTAGRRLTYTLTATNLGPSDATGVTLVDTLPAGVTYVSDDAGCDIGSLPTVSCTIGALASGASDSVTLVVDADSALADGVLLVNDVTVDGDQADDDPTNDDATQTTTVTRRADLEMEKSVQPTTAAVGDRVTYTLTARNLGPSAASNVVVSDNLPSGMTYVSDDAGCDTAGLPTLVCDLGDLDGGSMVIITIVAEIDPGTEGQTLRNAAVIGSDDDDPDDSNNEDDVPVEVAEAVDLSIGKSGAGEVVGIGNPAPVTVDPDRVTAGRRLTYTLTITNAGPATATNVVVTDTLPAGVSFVAADPACSLASPPDLVCTAATLAMGATETWVVLVDVSPDVADGSLLLNQAEVDADQIDTDDTNDTAQQTTTVEAASDLALIKDASPSTVDVGDTVTYTLTAVNAGPSTAADVTISDTLPSGVSHVSNDGGCDTGALPVITCDVGDLAPGASTTVQVVVEVLSGSEGQTLVNGAAVTPGTGRDPNPDNNDDDETVEVRERVDLEIEKNGAGALVAPGDPPSVAIVPNMVTAGRALTYTLDVRNDGPSAASDVTVTDTLPAGVTFVSASGASCSTVSLPMLVCDVGGLPAGGSISITIVVDVDADLDDGSLLVNGAQVTSAEPEDDPANNSDSQQTEVSTSADLELEKTADPDVVATGQPVTFTISVVNLGPSWARDVVITDTLPMSMTYQSDDAGCDATGAPEIVCDVGDLAPGAGTMVRITAVPEPGLEETVVTNVAIVDSGTGDPRPANNEDDADVGVGIPVDLSVAKEGVGEILTLGSPPSVQVVPGQVTAGRVVTWTMHITNSGLTTATGVVLTDTLPTGVIHQSDDAGCDATTPPSVVCTLGNLAPGASTTVQIVGLVDADVPEGTVLTNRAEVISDRVEVQGDDNMATHDTLVIERADLGVEKSAWPPWVTDGDQVEWRLRVSNNGSSLARDVTVTDTLPSGLSYVSDTDSCAETSPGSGTLVCELGDIQPGFAESFEIIAQVGSGLEGRTVTNTARVGLPLPAVDLDPSNDEDQATVDVVSPAVTADVTIKKSITETLSMDSGVITFTVAVINEGPQPAEAVVVTDTLNNSTPGLAQLTGATHEGCVVLGPELMRCELGDMAPGARIDFRVTARLGQLPQKGTHRVTNNVAVRSDTPDLEFENNFNFAYFDIVGGEFVAGTSLGPSQSLTLAWLDLTTSETEYEVQASLDGETWVPIAALPSRSTPQVGDEYRWISQPLPAGHRWAFRVVAMDPVEGRMDPKPSVGVFVTTPERPAREVGCYVGQVGLDGRSRHDGAWIMLDGVPVVSTDRRGGFRLCGARPGMHALAAWRPGFLSVAARASVAADGVTELPWAGLPGGDVDGDGRVDLDDLVLVGAALGQSPVEPSSPVDVNADRRIDLLDMVLVSAGYEQASPVPWWPDAMLPGALPWHRDPPPMPPAAPVTLQLRESELAGGARLVEVLAPDARGLYGADLTLSYDPSRWRVVDAQPERPGTQLSAGAAWTVDGEPFVAMDEAADGHMRFAASLLRPAGSQRGDLQLATALLEPRAGAGDGQAAVLEAGVLRTARAGRIPVRLGDGSAPPSPMGRIFLPRVVR